MQTDSQGPKTAYTKHKPVGSLNGKSDNGDHLTRNIPGPQLSSSILHRTAIQWEKMLSIPYHGVNTSPPRKSVMNYLQRTYPISHMTTDGDSAAFRKGKQN
uniref:Uncharacterized protein n=1 Tax=Magallana gigas TaxID=29159 RepID=A0A8W8MEC2_MAGGI